jgi:cupin 2 domain-containing protein
MAAFHDIPADLSAEQVDVLHADGTIRIERIVGLGHASPPGFWYDQPRDEWVLLVQGRARLRFESPDAVLEMRAGEHVHIPAHRRHRVEWTDPHEPCVWLAVHYG